jgi:SAM-dependent methyltransferase
MDWSAETIRSYDASSEQLAEYFEGIGPRVVDIERGLELAKATDGNAKVVEIGCGGGREASEIVKRAEWYEGIDPSEAMLNIAKSRLPDVSFVKADGLTYDYPKNVDVIFAFASLIHASRSELIEVMAKAVQALKPRGIFYISLKERDSYEEEVQEDKYGKRMYYYYNPQIIGAMANQLFEVVYEDHQHIKNTNWFTLALSKI